MYGGCPSRMKWRCGIRAIFKETLNGARCHIDVTLDGVLPPCPVVVAPGVRWLPLAAACFESFDSVWDIPAKYVTTFPLTGGPK